MNHFYKQFVSNISRTLLNGSFCVLCKPQLIFSRINGPIVLQRCTLRKISLGPGCEKLNTSSLG